MFSTISSQASKLVSLANLRGSKCLVTSTSFVTVNRSMQNLAYPMVLCHLEVSVKRN